MCPTYLLVNPAVPASTVPEFIAYTKTNPGKVNMGSGGTGGPVHMAGELFDMMTGLNMQHVPYRGEALALADWSVGRCRWCSAAYPRQFSTSGPANYAGWR